MKNENASQLQLFVSPFFFAVNRFVSAVSFARSKWSQDRFAVGNYNNRKERFVRQATQSAVEYTRAQRIAFAYGFDGAMNDDR